MMRDEVKSVRRSDGEGGLRVDQTGRAPVLVPGGEGRGAGSGKGGGDGAGPGRGRRRGARGNGQDTVLFEQVPIDEGGAATVVCCVDDTDDLSGATSTGYVAERIAAQVAGMGGRVVLGITRHQLLLAEGVPYTSHNSAMCFMALMSRGSAEALRRAAVDVIASEAAKTADPGLCVAELPAGDDARDAETARFIEMLVAFGNKAKSVVCTKEEAYALAERIPWLSLSEHGGTGDGVIGALAGAGLRLSGADGRFRGKWDVARLAGFPREAGDPDGERERDERLPAIPVSGLVSMLSALAGGPVRVVDARGRDLPGERLFALSRCVKPVLAQGALAIVTEDADGVAIPCTKVDLGSIGNGGDWRRFCDRFEWDNDVEECDGLLERSCRNCLYRRWTSRGFMCVARSAAVRPAATHPAAVR